MQFELELEPGDVIQIGDQLLTVVELHGDEVIFKIWSADDSNKPSSRWQQQPR